MCEMVSPARAYTFPQCDEKNDGLVSWRFYRVSRPGIKLMESIGGEKRERERERDRKGWLREIVKRDERDRRNEIERRISFGCCCICSLFDTAYIARYRGTQIEYARILELHL